MTPPNYHFPKPETRNLSPKRIENSAEFLKEWQLHQHLCLEADLDFADEPYIADPVAIERKLWRNASEANSASNPPSPPETYEEVQTHPFDTDITVGEIRVLSHILVGETISPVYVLVLREWDEEQWLIVPFSKFSAPATPGEVYSGSDEPPLRVLCCWNIRTVPAQYLAASWLASQADEIMMTRAWEVFSHSMNGDNTNTRPNCDEATGAPITIPFDPRTEYEDEETRLLQPLTQLSIHFVEEQEREEKENAKTLLSLFQNPPQGESTYLAADSDDKEFTHCVVISNHYTNTPSQCRSRTRLEIVQCESPDDSDTTQILWRLPDELCKQSLRKTAHIWSQGKERQVGTVEADFEDRRAITTSLESGLPMGTAADRRDLIIVFREKPH